MKHITFLFLLFFISFSATAQLKGSDKKFYKLYTKKYSDGLILNPSEKDINSAIKFGEILKDEENEFYSAYTFRKNLPAGYKTRIFLSIKTPLFLVSDYSRQQAIEYRDVDINIITNLARLKIVKFDLVQELQGSYVFLNKPTTMFIIKNGKRLKTLSKIPLINSTNYYENINSRQTTANTNTIIQKGMREALIKQVASLPEGQREKLIKIYVEQGLLPDSILTKTSQGQTNIQKTISVTEYDNYYNIEDLLDQKGKYELVFRSRSKGALAKEFTNIFIYTGPQHSGEEKEVKIPLDFSAFR